MYGLLIAQVDHQPPVEHGVVLVAVVLLAVVGALVYGLVRLVGKSRTGPTRSGGGPENDRAPRA
ncbi:MAG: hypothetical protein ACRDZ1_06550 [Acidimicrobiia bacterium]